MHPHNSHGFSLIEVLMVMAIFSIGILAVATLQVGAVNANSTARRITAGSAWLGDHIEKIMALGYDDPALAYGQRSTREAQLGSGHGQPHRRRNPLGLRRRRRVCVRRGHSRPRVKQTVAHS